MTHDFEFFNNVIGFSIGAINPEDDLDEYHPPECSSSLIHVTKNVVDYNNNYVLIKLEGTEENVNWSVVKRAWAGAKDVFDNLTLRQKNTNNPVTNLFQDGIITNKGSYVLDSYEILRVESLTGGDELYDQCPDRVINGPVYIDKMKWLEVIAINNTAENTEGFPVLTRKIKEKNQLRKRLYSDKHLLPLINNLPESSFSNFVVDNAFKDNNKKLVEQEIQILSILKNEIERGQVTPAQKEQISKILREVGDVITYESNEYEIVRVFESKWYWIPVEVE